MLNSDPILGNAIELKNVELGWFHRYPARFSHAALKEILSEVVFRMGRLPANILDPFAGTGASLALAKQIGIPSFGKELTPLGALICEVRLNPPKDLDLAFEVVESLVSSRAKGDPRNINSELKSWIGEENAAHLDFLLSEITQIVNSRLKNWLQLAVSSALRPSSRWLPGSIKPQIDPNRGFSNLKHHFHRVSRILKRDCERERALFRSDCNAKILMGDSRFLEFENESFDVIMTSPPYGSMYDYFDVHRLSYLAFKWGKSCDYQIGRSSRISKDGAGFIPPPHMKRWYYCDFRGETTIEGRALRAYFQDMETHFNEVYRVLKRGGVVAYAVANSKKRGRKFSLVKALREMIKKAGFCKVELKSREHSKKRILPAGRNMWSGRFDINAKPAVDEFIILGEKPGA